MGVADNERKEKKICHGRDLRHYHSVDGAGDAGPDVCVKQQDMQYDGTDETAWDEDGTGGSGTGII